VAIKNGVTIRNNKKTMQEMAESLRILADVELLVGFPEDTTERQSDDEGPMTNAALGYIHDNGSPDANIPARPFMLPGMEAVLPGTTQKLAAITNAVIKRGAGPVAVETAMHSIGLEAKLSIQNTITDGIPPPLADSTLRARARKRPNRIGPGLELLSRSKGNAPSNDFVTPLVDTGAMRNAVNYVIRSRMKRG
jgi:hypothetical protein